MLQELAEQKHMVGEGSNVRKPFKIMILH